MSLGVELSSYLLSKISVLSVICLLQGIMFLLIIYLRIDMGNKPALTVFGLFFLTSFTGARLGLLVSAIPDTQAKAMTLVPIVLLPQIIFAGGLIPLSGILKTISITHGFKREKQPSGLPV